MTKEPKAMKYAIEPIVKVLRSEANSDGGTQKKAEALEGKFIRLNENMFAFVEEAQTTIIYSDESKIGCACKAFSDPPMNVLCEHLIALRDLKSSPQLHIETKECRWLQTYLFSLGWYSKNRCVYPSLDAPEDKPPIEPEVVAELPPIEEQAKLDPVNEDKPLETGVDDEPETRTYSRKCVHCKEIISGTDLAQVKQNIAEHTKSCPKNPANKKTSPGKEDVTPKATDAKTATVEKPSNEMEKKVKPPSKKKYAHPDGAEFDSSEKLMDYADCIKEAATIDETKVLIAQGASEDDWTDNQLEVMRKTVAEKATPAEFAYFLNVAKYTGLNPFLREIYFMKTEKGQTTIITGRDGYLTIAKRDPRFRGIHSMEVCEKDEFEMGFDDGVMKVSKHNITDFKDRGEIIGAWACGQMDGQDTVTIFASMKEYDKSSNAMGGKIWKQYTSSMIRKVAESMVLKRIAGISGLVTEAEIGSSNLIVLGGGE